MKPALTQKEIGKRIMELRKLKGMSQRDLAGLLHISRSSLAQIELGKRNLYIEELMGLSEALGFSIQEFLSRDYNPIEELEEEPSPESTIDMRDSVPKLKVDKFMNVLLYILEKCAGKPNVGETVLYKLLYFSDFNYYEIYEEHLTGATYKKLPYGPVPSKLEHIIHKMIGNQQLKRIKSKYHGLMQTRYLPLQKADLTKFSAAEKEVIDKVIDRYSDWSAADISAYSHHDMPWKASKEGGVIDYELSFYREPPYSVRTYPDEPELP